MKIKINNPSSQVYLILIILLLGACNLKKYEIPVIPPLSLPLSQSHVGYGVVNVSYTRVMENIDDESESGASPGYLRRGAVVLIYERKQIVKKGRAESWLLVEENYKGWLKEIYVDVYENELQAKTASDSMR